MKKHVFINLIVIFVLLMSVGIVPTQRASSAGDGPEAPDYNLAPPIIQFAGLGRVGAIDNDIPDTTGAAGHWAYMQAVNTQIAIYNKSGTLLTPAVDFDTFWAGAPLTDPCNSANNNHHGDPNLLYDHMARRWVVVDVAYADLNIDTGPYYLCLAVSRDENTFPVPPPSFAFTSPYWHYYSITTNVNIYQYLPDMPKLGLWADGYYLSVDLVDVWNNGQNRTPAGVKVWALNRDDLQNGITPFRFVDFYLPEHMGFEHLVPTNLLGNPPPTGTPNRFASIQPGKLYFWDFHVDWLNPGSSTFGTPTHNPSYTLTTDTAALWATGSIIPQVGTAETLEAHGGRLMTPLQFRIVDGIYTYWVNHTVWNSALSLAGLRWYEFNQDTSGIPFIIQQGTWFPDRLTHRWLGSLAVDRDGNMAIGYSATRTDVGGPTIRYAGRLRTEPAGTLGPLENSFATPGYTIADNLNGVSDHPWGRQSQMSIDPADECLFWYTNSYFVAPVVLNQLWATRIGAFSFPNCGGGQNVRISLHTNGTQGNKSSGMDFEMYSVGISSDGRYVVFSSDATNLVAGDVNNLRDIFLRDRDVDMDGIYDETGQVSTTLISRDPNGLPANGNSWDVAISGNSRYIAYSSEASNLLLTADTNGTADVFVYDRFLDTTTRVSVTSGGAQAIGRSDQPFLNYTGRLVVFRSTAQNLAPGPMYNGTNIFLRDRDTDLNGDFDDTGGVVTALVSTNLNTPAGSPFPAPGAASFVDCYTPTISDSDFTSSSPAASQIINIAFACRITAPIGSSSVFGAVFAVNGLNIPPTITRVPSAPAVETAYTPFISGNGRFVVFVAQSWPVTPVAGTIMRMDFPSFSFASLIRISTTFLNPLVFTANPSFSPSISRDGRFVAYASNAPDLDIFPPDLNNLRDIFLWDEETGSNQRISLDFMGGDTNDWSFAPVISGDGGHVAYVSEASDLVNNDTNNVWDVFAFNGDQVRPKFLSIPSDQVVSPGSTVSVPVNFNSQGQSIDTVTFSIDFDEVCLAFDPTDSDADDIPDAITFNVSSDFVSSVTYNAADKDGELDFAIFDWTPPVRTNLPDGTLATIQFTVKATCQAAPGSSNTARVGFSNNPPPSFGYLGQSILGSSSDGFVRITDGILGDCNGDGLVDAGDLSGLVLEIFDGDGSNPMDTVGGTFAGNPVGCNPNQDYVIDAGDLSCTILIIQGNGATCTGLASIPAKTSWFDAGIPGTVKLEIPDQVPSFLNADTVIPVNLETGGNAISSAVFSVDFDEAWLSIDPADSNHDGLPDAIELSLPQGFMASTAFDPTDQDGELDFVIYNNPMAIPKTFSDGTIAKLTMRTGSPVKPTLAFIDWASDPRPSFGSVLGTSLASLTLNGSAYIAQLPYRLFSSGILG